MANYEKTVEFKFNYMGKDEKIVFGFNSKPYWKATKISGNSPMGNCSGGVYKNMEEYIKHIEFDLKYACSFFTHGYKYAKENA